MRYETASVTHIGHVRTVNQDRMLVRIGRKGDYNAAMLVVADGMGGLSEGEKASGAAVDALARWWGAFEGGELEEISEQLDAAIYEVHRQIYYEASEKGCQCGSTLSLVYLQGDECLLKQIGDSRVYLADEAGLTQLTVDQNWYNQVTASGQLAPEQAALNHKKAALVNALGVSDELSIETKYLPARRSTAYLLCSDGFYHMAPLQEITDRLRRQTPQKVLDRLLANVLEGPASDNASAVLCCLA